MVNLLGLIEAVDKINRHTFAKGAAKFEVDVFTNPWTVKMLDNDGNVILSIPAERIITIADTLGSEPINTIDTEA